MNILASLQALLPHHIELFFYPILPILLLSYALLPLRPLFTTNDDLADIPLTPKQRALLGLSPSAVPATPGSQYITPPRYSRSATPRGSNSSSRSESPFSGTGSPLGAGLTPSSYSPLYQKALGREQSRRLSLGSPSPLSLGRTIHEPYSSSTAAASATPLAGKGISGGLNSRWLYERGRRSSSALRM